MDKISSSQVAGIQKLAAASLRALSEENRGLKEKNASLEQEVLDFRRKDRAEKLASEMEEKGLQPEVPHAEKVASLLERSDLDVVSEAIKMSAPQMKLASVHEDGSPDVSPTGDEDGRAAAQFGMALLADES